MFAGRSREEWIAQYATSHQNRVNRACHTVGIPLIVASIAAMPAAAVTGRGLRWPLAAFGAGWALQFVGHAFEGKPPEFLHDWRFLFVGVRWWWAKMQGRA